MTAIPTSLALRNSSSPDGRSRMPHLRQLGWDQLPDGPGDCHLQLVPDPSSDPSWHQIGGQADPNPARSPTAPTIPQAGQQSPKYIPTDKPSPLSKLFAFATEMLRYFSVATSGNSSYPTNARFACNFPEETHSFIICRE